MNKIKEKGANGITLVALVVTVIILLILAGITIAGLTGEKGLIKEAKTAKELTEKAALEEQIELAIIKAEQKHLNPTLDDVIEEMKNNKVISKPDQVDRETGAVRTDAGYLIEGKLDDYIGKTSTGDGNTTGGNNTGDGNTTGGGDTPTPPTPTLPSTADTTPFLPEGATVLENDIDEGIVIRDSNGNEWVWIEVPKSIYSTAKTCVDCENIENDMQTYAVDYREGSYYSDTFYSTGQYGFENATEYNNWKNSMLESVFNNGGFYIGRYEIGTDSPVIGTSILTSLTEPPYIKQDMLPYRYISGGQAQTLAKQLSTGGKQSSLMFGIQWDLVMKFIETKGGKTQSELKTNSSTWGNHKNISFELTRGKYFSEGTWNNIVTYTKPNSAMVLSTGATDRNSTLNIYDLAGNVYEWTLEQFSYGTQVGKCVARGGDFADEGYYRPCSMRQYRKWHQRVIRCPSSFMVKLLT